MALSNPAREARIGASSQIADSSDFCWRPALSSRWWVSPSFSILYVKYQSIVDARLQQPIFANTAKIYAAPREVRPGQKLTVQLDR